MFNEFKSEKSKYNDKLIQLAKSLMSKEKEFSQQEVECNNLRSVLEQKQRELQQTKASCLNLSYERKKSQSPYKQRQANRNLANASFSSPNKGVLDGSLLGGVASTGAGKLDCDLSICSLRMSDLLSPGWQLLSRQNVDAAKFLEDTRGGMIAFVGRVGAGKSTLIYSLLRGKGSLSKCAESDRSSLCSLEMYEFRKDSGKNYLILEVPVDVLSHANEAKANDQSAINNFLLQLVLRSCQMVVYVLDTMTDRDKINLKQIQQIQ